MTLEELKDAIDKVVKYNWDAELENYRENPGPHHVFHTLVELDNFTSGVDSTVEDHLNR